MGEQILPHNPRIMLTGANGQVGWELSRSLLPLGEVVALTRKECDLSRPETLPSIVQKIKPDVIVNAAAYTAVDKAEEQEALATTINGTSVGVLAEEAKKRNTLFIHYSTDYVFDGTKQTPYHEDDMPNPINAYGRSKLAGEMALRDVGGKYLIFRTSWVYASRGRNFIRTVLRLAHECAELKFVNDQVGAPTWARNIADVTILVVGKYMYGQFENYNNEHFGIYHLTAAGQTTWYEFAKFIIEKAVSLQLVSPRNIPIIDPITSDKYPLPAKRPLNSVLSNNKFQERFLLNIPDWNKGFEYCFAELLQE